jgi:phosphatidylinositol alpha-1,6-mannosyltransferase
VGARTENPDVRFITRKWAPAMGGMETYCVRLTGELGKTHRLDIIALPGKPDGDVPSAGALIGFGLKTAVRLLFAKPAKIVHLGDVAIWPLGWIASLRHPKSRIILSAHGSDLNYATKDTLSGRFYAAYVKLGARSMGRSRLIANSDWIAELAGHLGFQDVTKVALATDIGSNIPAGPHNDCLFFAGRITPSKGLSFIVNRVLPLMERPTRIRVAGTIWDSKEAKTLESPLVDYLGNLAPDELIAEYRQSMAVIVPSLGKEGFGLVAAEAAACGAVVIASDHSGLAEVVTPDIGLLADSSLPEQWIAAIEKIRSWTAQKRATFTKCSQSIASTRYGWDRVARETVAVYDKV